MEQNISRPEILGQKSKPISVDTANEMGCTLIDVRSAAEFHDGTILGALNVPLFDEDERAIIGTIYRHGGHEQAIDKGFDVVRKKLIDLLTDFEPYRNQKLAVFCARGGMRSLSIVNLLNQSGYRAQQLVGGYKQHRHEVLDRLDAFEPKLIVIHGLTGTGKTRILQKLPDAIDLEELAKHRSSIFGGMDREPSNQRNFESELAQSITLLKKAPYFIEGESRKIGRVFMPKPLAVAMKKAILVNVHCSLETRVARILEDYPVAGQERIEQIEGILRSLTRKMGVTQVNTMCRLLNSGEIGELVRILLVDYYDSRYKKSMANYRFTLELSSENIEQAAEELIAFRGA